MKTGGRLSKLINMKTIVLLRHGESTWNRENRFTGWTDVDLTELGIQEANHAGDLRAGPFGPGLAARLQKLEVE